MKHLRGIRHLNEVNLVASVGMFDGVHRGHQALLRRLQTRAQALQSTYVLITFWPHPRHVLSDVVEPRLLSTEEEKKNYLEDLGLPYLLTLPFDAAFAARSKDSFLEEVLIQGIGVRHLIVGPGHRFGQGAAGTLSDLQRRATRGNFSVETFPPEQLKGDVISSTAIREALQNKHLSQANSYLGYPYSLRGQVQKGQQLGRKIGFPTANLALLDPHKLLPAAGVYAVEAKVQQHWHKGMLYIGKKSIAGHPTQTIEVNIFNLEANLYGKELPLRLHSYLRDEKQLLSKEALALQLKEDKIQAIQALQQVKKV